MTSNNRTDDQKIVASVESVLRNELNENREFNDFFNGADPLLVASLDREQEPHRFEKSEVLFFTDRDAYYSELELWENGVIAAEHKATLDAIAKQDQMPLFKELIDAVSRQRVAPFVGAGFSFDSKYPMWGTALREFKEKIEGVDDGLFQQAMNRFDYLEAAQLLWDQDATQLKNLIRTKFSDGRLPDGKATGPVTLLASFCHGCVITTNFDSVIETVFSKPFEGYMHGMQAGNKFVPKLIKGDRCLLKLHGDAEDHETYVFTRNQYKTAYGEPFDFTKPLPKALRQIFVSHSLLFLGCSLENDKTLELFTHVCDQGEFEIPNHFAIIPEPKPKGLETKAQKENRLLKLKIHPIWFPDGEFKLVEAYLQLLIDVANKRIRV